LLGVEEDASVVLEVTQATVREFARANRPGDDGAGSALEHRDAVERRDERPAFGSIHRDDGRAHRRQHLREAFGAPRGERLQRGKLVDRAGRDGFCTMGGTEHVQVVVTVDRHRQRRATEVARLEDLIGSQQTGVAESRDAERRRIGAKVARSLGQHGHHVVHAVGEPRYAHADAHAVGRELGLDPPRLACLVEAHHRSALLVVHPRACEREPTTMRHDESSRQRGEWHVRRERRAVGEEGAQERMLL
jgi:hypothetical protein